MPDLPSDLPGLERLRAELYEQMSRVGDFRRGALNAVRRKCGKPNCACAQPGHAGHGPQYNLTRNVAGKTVNTRIRPGPELDKAERESRRAPAVPGPGRAAGRGERGDLRVTAGPAPAGRAPFAGGGKGGLCAALQTIIAAEVTQLAERAAALAGSGCGLRVLEEAFRAALMHAGAVVLAAVLDSDDGYRGAGGRLRSRPPGRVRRVPAQVRRHRRGPDRDEPRLVSLRRVSPRPRAGR